MKIMKYNTINSLESKSNILKYNNCVFNYLNKYLLKAKINNKIKAKPK